MILDVVAYAYDLSTQNTEVERRRVQVQPGLHSKTLSQKQNEEYKIAEDCIYWECSLVVSLVEIKCRLLRKKASV